MGGGRGSQEFGKQACHHGFHLWSWSILHFMLLAGLMLPDCAPKVMTYWMGPRLYSGSLVRQYVPKFHTSFLSQQGDPPIHFVQRGSRETL